jgi:TRAP-type C4-dicarboxylate transport system substrate-binding protein
LLFIIIIFGFPRYIYEYKYKEKGDYMKGIVWCALAIILLVVLLSGCSTTASSSATQTAKPAQSTTAPQPTTSPSSSLASQSSGATQASSTTAAQAKPIKIKIATYSAEAHVLTQAARKLEADLKDFGKGQIEVSVFPNSTLLADAAMVDGIPNGLADIGVIGFSQWTGRVPDVSAMSLAGVYQSEESYWKVRENGLDDYIAKKLEDNTKVKLVNWMQAGTSDAFYCSKKQLRLPADFAGLKFRAPNKTMAEEIASLSASGVVLPVADVYTSLQSGVIQGAVSNVSSFDERKYAEVVPYLSQIAIAYGDAYGIVINRDSWNSWPKTVQDEITRMGKEIRTWSIKQTFHGDKVNWDKYTADKRVTDYVVPQSDLPKFQELLAPGQLATLKSQVGDKSYQEIIQIINKSNNSTYK